MTDATLQGSSLLSSQESNASEHSSSVMDQSLSPTISLSFYTATAEPLSSVHSQLPRSPTSRTSPPTQASSLSDPASLATVRPSQNRSPSPMPMDCRCGSQGDGNVLADGLTTIQCDTCGHWSHIACQRYGSASRLAKNARWRCYLCDVQNTLIPRFA